MKIVVIVGGSIAAYKACDVVSKLVQGGHVVRCVLTAGGAKFVGAATLEGLSGRKVLGDLFEGGEALEHIQLNRWSDVTLVCPASASLLNRLAAGLGEDLAGAMFLAREPQKPWLIAPAMNPHMWSHAATRGSVAKLREWGLRFIDPAVGRTACDEVGEGRLAETCEIVQSLTRLAERAGVRGDRRSPQAADVARNQVTTSGVSGASGDVAAGNKPVRGAGPPGGMGVADDEAAGNKPVRSEDWGDRAPGGDGERATRRRLRVLVTSGGTAEPIDAVRVLTNVSTGTTGAGIAGHFSDRGHEVTLLRARNAVEQPTCRAIEFVSFADLSQAMEHLLRTESFDLVIHAAAVSDFTIDSIEVSGWLVAPGGNKLDSAEPPTLRLRPTPKLVDAIHGWSRNPDLLLVAFKLTAGLEAGEGRQAALSLLEHSHAGLVVLNDITQRKSAIDFPAEGIAADGETIFRCDSRDELPGQLESFALSYAALP